MRCSGSEGRIVGVRSANTATAAAWIRGTTTRVTPDRSSDSRLATSPGRLPTTDAAVAKSPFPLPYISAALFRESCRLPLFTSCRFPAWRSLAERVRFYPRSDRVSSGWSTAVTPRNDYMRIPLVLFREGMTCRLIPSVKVNSRRCRALYCSPRRLAGDGTVIGASFTFDFSSFTCRGYSKRPTCSRTQS